MFAYAYCRHRKNVGWAKQRAAQHIEGKYLCYIQCFENRNCIASIVGLPVVSPTYGLREAKQ